MDEIVQEYLSEPEEERSECYVCGKEIPTQRGSQPMEGGRYALIRENIPSRPYVMTERLLHTDCFTEYLNQREE